MGTLSSQGKQAFEFKSTSTNGGSTWSKPAPAAGPLTQPGLLDPVQGRPLIDGVAGARSDLALAPSVDIADGSPSGANATDRMVMSYVSGTVDAPHVFFTESTDRVAHWTTPRALETPGHGGLFTAPVISPNGTDVNVVYNAFTTQYRPNTTARGRSWVWCPTPTPRPVLPPRDHSPSFTEALPGTHEDPAPMLSSVRSSATTCPPLRPIKRRCGLDGHQERG